MYLDTSLDWVGQIISNGIAKGWRFEFSEYRLVEGSGSFASDEGEVVCGTSIQPNGVRKQNTFYFSLSFILLNFYLVDVEAVCYANTIQQSMLDNPQPEALCWLLWHSQQHV